jgi:hypothetical protein
MVRLQSISSQTWRNIARLEDINNWDTELKEMNKDKVGEPFHYPDTFLLLLFGYAKVYFHLPYRQTEGIAQGHVKGKVPHIPDYSTISRRIIVGY